MIAGHDYIGIGMGALVFDSEGRIFLAKRGEAARNERGYWEFPGGRRGSSGAVANGRRGRAEEPIGAALVSSRTLLGPAVGVARTPADRHRAGLPDRPGEVVVGRAVSLGSERDHVGELGHRVQIAERGQAGQPECVELVTEQ